METGYLHPRYAQSFSEFGIARALPRCKGWILERHIPGCPYRDAMGCYPLFVCQDWSKLDQDLEEVEDGLISLAVVTDPFGEYDEAYLHKCFGDVVIPFKEHFIADLKSPVEDIVSKHHLYYARKTLKSVSVEPCPDPTQFTDEWINLYATLIEKHQLKGVKAFSHTAFAEQLKIPGMVVLRAISRDSTVGAHLWYVQGDVAYSHLAAFSPQGYDLMASYALYYAAIEYFSDKVRWLEIGAGAGTVHGGTDGLSQFKRGWSTGTRTAYFCGRIFDQAKYTAVVEAKGTPPSTYFPAYRSGELD